MVPLENKYVMGVMNYQLNKLIWEIHSPLRTETTNSFLATPWVLAAEQVTLLPKEDSDPRKCVALILTMDETPLSVLMDDSEISKPVVLTPSISQEIARKRKISLLSTEWMQARKSEIEFKLIFVSSGKPIIRQGIGTLEQGSRARENRTYTLKVS